VITRSTRLTNGLRDCPGDGLVIGAPRVIVDLDGHTLDGIGLGSGIRNDGYASVTVRNGSIQQFDRGVQLLEDSHGNLVERLALRHNEVAAIELFDVAGGTVRANTLDSNGGGISLVSGTTGVVVAGNSVTENGGAAIQLRDAGRNRVEANTVADGHDLGIWLERASGNTLSRNVIARNSDGGIELQPGSHGNLVTSNRLRESGDHGILVKESHRNQLVSNVTHSMSDSGIFLQGANDGTVRGNDVRFNSGGMQVDGSRGNVIEANDASRTTGIGIELQGDSYGNTLLLNTANGNGAEGIHVAVDAAGERGNRLERNSASGNRSSGIVVAKGGHAVVGNVARNNADWGILAAPGNVDGGRNAASGNGKVGQCAGVVCRPEWVAPNTSITQAPPNPSTSATARFSFTGSDDSTAPASLRFQCSLDAAAYASCTSPRTYSGLANGAHTFRVRAIDRAGNVDPSPATYRWTVVLTLAP
jgi:parallel beta-helix repeat protein